MKLFKILLFVFPLLTYGQIEKDTILYKNQIGLNVSSLNPFAPITSALLKKTSSIFSDNYYSGIGIEVDYYRKFSKKLNVGAIIGLAAMNPLKGGNLDQPRSHSSLTKFALTVRYILNENIVKPYIAFEAGYYFLHYKSDSIGVINTNGIGIAPSIGLMVGIAPFLNLNMNLAENLILPLNNYLGLWTTPKFNIGLIYNFNGKKSNN